MEALYSVLRLQLLNLISLHVSFQRPADIGNKQNAWCDGQDTTAPSSMTQRQFLSQVETFGMPDGSIASSTASWPRPLQAGQGVSYSSPYSSSKAHAWLAEGHSSKPQYVYS